MMVQIAKSDSTCESGGEALEASMNNDLSNSNKPSNIGRPEHVTVPSLSQQQLLQLALSGPVPRFYANHCAIAQTASDLAIILISNNNPVATVNLSYETSKFMIEELQKVISKYEEAAGQKVKSNSEIQATLQRIVERDHAKSSSNI